MIDDAWAQLDSHLGRNEVAADLCTALIDNFAGAGHGFVERDDMIRPRRGVGQGRVTKVVEFREVLKERETQGSGIFAIDIVTSEKSQKAR